MSPLSASRPLFAALARFVVVFAVLIAPWPGLGRAFTDAVGAVATALADPIFVASNVTFTLRSPLPSEALPDWRGVIDVRQDFPDRPVRDAGAIDLRRAGWLQLTMFIALAAGWPPRGRIALAVCVAVAIVSSSIALPIVDYLSQVGAIHFAWARAAIALSKRALVAAPGMAYAMPGLAWLAMSRRVASEGHESASLSRPPGGKGPRHGPRSPPGR